MSDEPPRDPVTGRFTRPDPPRLVDRDDLFGAAHEDPDSGSTPADRRAQLRAVTDAAVNLTRTSAEYQAWLAEGIDRGWVAEPTCATHDGIPLSREEMAAVDDAFDPCLPVLRVWGPLGEPPPEPRCPRCGVPEEAESVSDMLAAMNCPHPWHRGK